MSNLNKHAITFFSNEESLQRVMFTVIVGFFTATRQSVHLLSEVKKVQWFEVGLCYLKNKHNKVSFEEAQRFFKITKFFSLLLTTMGLVSGRGYCTS